MVCSGKVDGWIVLRVGAARTLRLAKSLTAAGFDVWTPTATIVKRTPRKRERRECQAPMMPTFVFARLGDKQRLFRERLRPGTDHPPFSVFQHAGRVPEIADAEVGVLREAEARSQLAALKSRPVGFKVGQAVRPTEGAFAGMSGVIERAQGKYALVCFDGALRVKIAAWHLPEDMAQAA